MKLENLKFEYLGWTNPEDSCRVTFDITCGTTKAEVSLSVYPGYPEEAQVHVGFVEEGKVWGQAIIHEHVRRMTPEYAKATHAFASRLKDLGLD